MADHKPRDSSTRGKKPALLKPAVRAKLLEALKAGATHQIACDYAGIGGRTFYRAMAWAREGVPEWVGFDLEVDAASSTCAVAALAIVRKTAMGGNWQAAAWLLERRFGYVRPPMMMVADGAKTADDAPLPDPTPEQDRADLEERAALAGMRLVPIASDGYDPDAP